MKKFLSKKPVMIAFIAAAVAFLAFYIATLAWPVSYHLPYKDTITMGGTEIEYTIKFKSNEKMYMETSTSEGTDKEEVWIYRDGNLVFMLGGTDYMNEAEYKEAVKELKAAKKENKKAYEAAADFEVNAFQVTAESPYAKLEAVSAGSIVLAVVGGVIELALIAGATMSILYRRKK